MNAIFQGAFIYGKVPKFQLGRKWDVKTSETTPADFTMLAEKIGNLEWIYAGSPEAREEHRRFAGPISELGALSDADARELSRDALRMASVLIEIAQLLASKSEIESVDDAAIGHLMRISGQCLEALCAASDREGQVNHRAGGSMPSRPPTAASALYRVATSAVAKLQPGQGLSEDALRTVARGERKWPVLSDGSAALNRQNAAIAKSLDLGRDRAEKTGWQEPRRGRPSSDDNLATGPALELLDYVSAIQRMTPLPRDEINKWEKSVLPFPVELYHEIKKLPEFRSVADMKTDGAKNHVKKWAKVCCEVLNACYHHDPASEPKLLKIGAHRNQTDKAKDEKYRAGIAAAAAIGEGRLADASARMARLESSQRREMNRRILERISAAIQSIALRHPDAGR